ncbi:hypothetical protein ACFFX0_21085 [Citricoccus parietis]|uniref:Uncharacterized protein n=1 Tax=Citricoccus parietis TaxID=592307 RepID=A0ABV5G3P7_9MICC
MAGQVQCRHPASLREQWADVVPPPGMGAATVHQHDIPASLLSPGSERDLRSPHRDGTQIGLMAQCLHDPIRR